jgi:hypothetical protein
MKITNIALKNPTMNRDEIKAVLTFDHYNWQKVDFETYEIELDEKDLTNLKNDLQFVYDQFMKFKGE